MNITTMNTDSYIPAVPATAYQLYLVSLGHELTRHVPFADENAADEFSERFESANPILGCDRP